MTSTLAREQRLRTTDRCDRCGAQAFVKVTLDSGGLLLFCNHHFRAHEEQLRVLAQEILDETNRLTELAATAED